MSKEEVLKDIQSLMEDIDNCENELVKAKLTDDISRLVNAYCQASKLLVQTKQELDFLYGYIEDYEYKFTDLAEHWLHIQFNLEKMECSDIEKFVKQFKDYVKQSV